MSTTTPNAPVTPVRPTAMATRDAATDIHENFKKSSSQTDLNDSKKLLEALVIRKSPDKIEVLSTQAQSAIKDPPATRVNHDEHDAQPEVIANESVTSPHALEPFDWDDFQARYNQAMAEAKTTEEALLNDFHELANYFGIWAAAASEYDDERALKRLKTRETYIQNAEQSLDEKKRHYTQVVEAFKNALALLGGP